MSPLPSRNTAVPEAEANGGLPQFVAGTGADQKVYLVGLENEMPYWYSFQDSTAQWTVKNHPLPNKDKQRYDALTISKGHEGRLYVVGLTKDGKPHVPCCQNKNGEWEEGPSIPTKGTTKYTALIAGMGDGKNLHLVGLTEDGQADLVCYQKNDGNWKAGHDFHTTKTEYTSLVTGMLNGDNQHVFGLTKANRVPDLACYRKNGVWQSGHPFTRAGNEEYQELVAGMASDKTLQLIGLTTKGMPHLPCYRATDGSWQKGGNLPSLDPQHYRKLVTGMGADGKLQVLGLGDDNKLYHVCSHVGGAQWKQGTLLSELENRTYSAITIAQSAKNTLLVLGLGETDKEPYLVCWQDKHGDWHPGPPLATTTQWVGIQKQGFSPNKLSARYGDAIVFYLEDREVTTDLSTDPADVFQNSKHITVDIGGISFQRANKKGYFRTSKRAEQDQPPNEPMEGSITVSKGEGH